MLKAIHYDDQPEILHHVNEVVLDTSVIHEVELNGEGQQHFKPAASPRHKFVGDPRVDVCFVVVVEKLTPHGLTIDRAIVVVPNSSLEYVLVQHPAYPLKAGSGFLKTRHQPSKVQTIDINDHTSPSRNLR